MKDSKCVDLRVQLVKESLAQGKSVRESLDEALVQTELGKCREKFLDSLNALIKAHSQLMDDWDKLEDVDPSFADVATEEYPYHKSFDDLLFDIVIWRNHLAEVFETR